MPYDQRYESELLRGVEEPRPWDLLQVIKRHAKKSDVLLDIGCGTAFKTIQLAGDVKEIYGLEPNERMRAKAEENIGATGVCNIVLVDGRAEELPFEDSSFDIVTCMVAPHVTLELHRVLRPNGYAIVEKIGDRDKWNFKEEFGSDSTGPRGQLSDLPSGERARIYEEEFGRLFSEVSVQNEFWKTYYSLEGLLLLLAQTPTVRNFDAEVDGEALQRIQRKYATPKGIETKQNRILIIARK
jgi:SAM-dependent methyltransferase